ncbi:MAG: tRNA (adenosine(37)-N6)-threonylcarbamoyltransferase complex ATPase subunit type 1 TsaE [Proteobacteria bacterium]|nr:tRNA (adenosine(37)-N6)-threonylcarbamoyltransferase complex ATPase subunit type 1 TsaE [Pseudomonadota bacterium]
MEEKEFISKSPSDTWDIGEQLGKNAKRGDLYTLYGELGAGKTQLVKGMARGIGVKDWQYVVSPSFTIMNIYEGDLILCHVDLYRIDGGEVESFALEEFLDNGIVVVEWAQRATWQDGVIRIKIEAVSEEERKIVVNRP